MIVNFYIKSLYNTILIPLIIIAFGFFMDILRFIILDGLSGFLGLGFAYFFDMVVTFVGVIHHELSHLVMAFLTGAKIKKVCLYRINFKEQSLGYVHFFPRGPLVLRSIQMMLSSLAPVYIGLISVWWLWTFIIEMRQDFWYKSIVVYLIFSILWHMRLSSADIKVSLKGILCCLPLMYLIILITRFDLVSILQKIIIIGG